MNPWERERDEEDWLREHSELLREFQGVLATLDTITIEDEDGTPYVTLSEDGVDRLAQWLWGLNRHWLNDLHYCRTVEQSTRWMWHICSDTMAKFDIDDEIGREAFDWLENRVYDLIRWDVQRCYHDYWRKRVKREGRRKQG